MKFKQISVGVSLLLFASAAFSAPLMAPNRIVAATSMPTGAPANRYAEVGDAGDSLGTAQAVGAGQTLITGLGGTGDVDMYSFIWGGGALTIDSGGSLFDTQLFLFDDLGNGVLGNDDGGTACGGGLGLLSCLDLSAGLAAGTYYLAISAFNNDPLDAGAVAMMSCATFSDQCVATGGQLDSWTAGSTTPGITEYSINFSAATGGGPMGAPEPGILLLMGLGIAGLGFARRRA